MRPIQEAFANGWTALLPIERGEKRPAVNRWPDYEMTPEKLSVWEQGFTTTFGHKGTLAPGLDIDIDNKEVAAQVVKLAHELLGYTPVRFGRFPRCLLPYRSEEPIPHQELTIVDNDTGEIWQVEILGDRQQYVLMGIHPDTGEPYKWNRGESPDVVAFDMLPFVDAKKTNAFLKYIATIFPESEYTTTMSGGSTRVGPPPSAASLRAPDISAVVALVETTPNPTSNGWAQFVQMGLAMHGATGGSDDGKYLFGTWCQSWERGPNNQADVDKLWNTAKPISGWHMLQKLAHSFGREQFNSAPWDFDVVEDEPVTSVAADTVDTQQLPMPKNIADYLAQQDQPRTLAFDVPSERWFGYYGGVWHAATSGRGLAFPLAIIGALREQMVATLEALPLAPNEKAADRQKKINKILAPTFAKNVRIEMEASGHWAFDASIFDKPELTNHLLNTPGGTYNLDTYELLPFDPAQYLTHQTVVAPQFDDTKHPLWDALLKRVVKNDDERDFLKRFLGSALGGTTANKIMLTMYGASNSGKSTITDTIASNVLGVGPDQYAAVASGNILLRRPQSRDDDHPTGLFDVRAARFAISHEGGDGMRWNENIIKRLTGGDTLPARRMKENFSGRRFYGRLIATTNLLPTADFIDSGMRQRMVIMELQRIPDDVLIDLRDDIEAEAPWILGWLIMGHEMERQRPVTNPAYVPESIKAETRESLNEEDPVGRFVSEALVLDDKAFTSTADLYDALQIFCSAREIPLPQMGSRQFGKLLKQMPELAPRWKKRNTSSGYLVALNMAVMEPAETAATINDLID